MINYELINSIFSLVADHLQAQHSAIKMLHSRVRLILDYVKAAQKGEVPVCHEALRLAYSLSHRLPVIQRDRFEKDFNAVSYFIFSFFHGTKFCFYILISLIFFCLQQCADVSLITYLGMITKGCEEAHQYISRFNMLHEKHAMSRRMRGLFY